MFTFLSFRKVSKCLNNIHLIWCFILLIGVSCQTKPSTEEENISDNGIKIGKALPLQYAKNFEIFHYPNYKLLKIKNAFSDSPEVLEYILLDEGLEAPKQYPKAQIIRTPISKLLTTSLSHIAFTDKLQSTEVIVGHAGTDYLGFSPIMKRLEAGKVQEIGQPQQLNHEIMMQLAPATLMLSGTDQKRFQALKVLRDANLKVIVNTEWREAHPLGRAEWLLIFGLLFNRYEEAQKLFEDIVKKYETVKAKVKDTNEQPRILSETPFKGTWYVAGGASYMAKLIEDAGGNYIWSDDKSAGSLPLDFEAVFAKAQDADIWIKPGNVNTLQELASQNSRFRDFKPFKQKQVYNNNKRVNDKGGNDYWINGIVEPHIILSDLAKIFHPSTLPSHKLYYFKKIK